MVIVVLLAVSLFHVGGGGRRNEHVCGLLLQSYFFQFGNVKKVDEKYIWQSSLIMIPLTLYFMRNITYLLTCFQSLHCCWDFPLEHCQSEWS